MIDIKDVIKKIVSYNEHKPLDSYSLNYQAMQNQLEPTYYWILDFMTPMFDKIEKITDNFTSSPGSGHFVEMSQRATRMQEEGMKIMGTINQIVKSVLNLIYDLRDFKQRLKHYEDSKSKNPETRDGGELALKQIWLDSVDVYKRQSGSIHQMTSQLGYTTLRDAFMIAKSLEDIEKMAKEDGLINDTVKRILIPRFKEYQDWKVFSEKELRKRYNIERSYLKSQIETLKLYSTWAQPYLKAAEELRQQGFDNNAALVSAFSTSMFELSLLATKKIKPSSEKYSGRVYYAVVVVNFKYRGHLMQKMNQRGDFGPMFEGKIDMNFDSYAINEDELKLIHDEIEKAKLGDSLTFNSNIAQEALEEIKEDLDEFLNEKDDDKKEEKKQKEEDDINPFSALLKPLTSSSKRSSNKKSKEIKEPKDIPKDSWEEKDIRVQAVNKVTSTLYKVYDIYKKAHGMASSPEPFDITEKGEPGTELRDLFEKVKK